MADYNPNRVEELRKFRMKIVEFEGHHIWKGRFDSTGIPCFKWMGRYYDAAKVIFSSKYARNIDSLVIHRKCTCPTCVNPEHYKDDLN